MNFCKNRFADILSTAFECTTLVRCQICSSDGKIVFIDNGLAAMFS